MMTLGPCSVPRSFLLSALVSILWPHTFDLGVAQLAERPAVNRKVVGSSPTPKEIGDSVIAPLGRRSPDAPLMGDAEKDSLTGQRRILPRLRLRWHLHPLAHQPKVGFVNQTLCVGES